MKTAYVATRLVTCDGNPGELGVVENALLVVENGLIDFVGPLDTAPAELRSLPRKAIGNGVVTPGLVDAHTHAAWTGNRHEEYAMRMAGASYVEIAAAGGGILSSHRAIATSADDELANVLCARLARMASLGVTTVEVKSGYGLTANEERKQLRAIASAGARADLPHVVPTFLALHALPQEARQNDAAREAYVAGVVSELLPEIAESKLATFVDAYVDANAFSSAEARTLAEASKTAGLELRLHAGQFADIGAAELAAEYGAASVDHLEHLPKRGAEALAQAKVAAVLLPLASFTLGQAPPPVALLREAGASLVVASDANPGTAPTESLPLAMAFAVRSYGMTPTEVLLGATKHAARSLRSPRGVLRRGAPADFVVWDLPHEFAIIQPWGTSKTSLVVRDGMTIYEAAAPR
ncbi:MAG: imidazolonepropionase [Polyangiaceae bacterium]